MATDLRKKRIWTVADFARYTGMSHKQARSTLKRFNVELGGLLLKTSGGKKPEYTFFPAALAKVMPELFEQIESLENRVEELEERLDAVFARERQIASQVGQNSREILRLQRRPKAA